MREILDRLGGDVPDLESASIEAQQVWRKLGLDRPEENRDANATVADPLLNGPETRDFRCIDQKLG